MLDNVSAFERYMEHKLKEVDNMDDYDKCADIIHTVLDFLVYNGFISEEDAMQLHFKWIAKIYNKQRNGYGDELLEEYKAWLKAVEEEGFKWTLF